MLRSHIFMLNPGTIEHKILVAHAAATVSVAGVRPHRVPLAAAQESNGEVKWLPAFRYRRLPPGKSTPAEFFATSCHARTHTRLFPGSALLRIHRLPAAGSRPITVTDHADGGVGLRMKCE